MGEIRRNFFLAGRSLKKEIKMIVKKVLSVKVLLGQTDNAESFE